MIRRDDKPYSEWGAPMLGSIICHTPAWKQKASICDNLWFHSHTNSLFILYLERADGIEPTIPLWKSGVLPLNYARIWRGQEVSRPVPDRQARNRDREGRRYPCAGGTMCAQCIPMTSMATSPKYKTAIVLRCSAVTSK